MTHWYDDDDRTLAELRLALAPEPIPGIEAAASALFAWRNIDEDLASLAYDSALVEAADVRGDEPDSAVLRTLTFTTTTMTIEIGVRRDRVLGQVVPPQGGTVHVHTEAGVFGTADIDDLGCFTVIPMPREAFRLHLTTGGDRVLTAWIRV